MSTQQKKRLDRLPTLRYLLLTIIWISGLIAVLVITATLEKDSPMGFLTPYKSYLSLLAIVILGGLAIESGSHWLYNQAVMRMDVSTAVALRIIVRIIAWGIILSIVASLLTANVAVALTTGAFAGLVAGLATQAVIGNTVAGIFIAIFRPVRIGDNVTISGNTGVVTSINLMHTILGTEDQEIMIPSSQIITSVLIRHNPVKA